MGYGNRKPNELSGGQKQRVAIARALIKDPRIIMADEPTGALDSNTGKAVFETLQKLSEEKLVIIVSHDRENAEIYADRIIELADGRVISDETKHKANGGIVSRESDKFVQGYVLSDADAKLIKDYISGARIPTKFDFSFKQTTPQDIISSQADNSHGKMIASRLPIVKALKMGASPIKAKPIRMFFTVLLCLVAFTLFGLVDTLACFNYVDSYYSAIKIGEYDSAMFSVNNRETHNGTDYYYSNDQMTEDDVKTIAESLSGEASAPLIACSGSIQNIGSATGNSEYYSALINNVVVLDSDDMTKFGYDVTGTMPQQDNEVALSMYYFDVIKNNGFTVSGFNDEGVFESTFTEGKNFTTASAFLSTKPVIEIEGVAYNLTAFFDTGIQDNENYTILKEGTTNNNNEYYTAMSKFSNEKLYSLSGALVVTQTVFDLHKEEAILNANRLDGSIEIVSDGQNSSYGISSLIQFDSTDEKVLGFEGDNLADDEILLDWTLVNIILGEKTITAEDVLGAEFFEGISFGDNFEPIANEHTFNYYTLSNIKYSYETERREIEYNVFAFYLSTADFTDAELENLYYMVSSIDTDDFEEDILSSFNSGLSRLGQYGYSGNALTDMQKKFAILYEFTSLNDEDRIESLQKDIVDYTQSFIVKEFLSDVTAVTGTFMIWDDQIGEMISKNFNVAGIYDLYEAESWGGECNIVANSNFYNTGDELPQIYSGVLFSLPEDEDALKALIALGIEDGRDTIFKIVTPISNDFEFVYYITSDLSSVMLYVGLGFALFAMLMMFNFMSVSIVYKRNEIGILRAIGSRGGDVFKIFFSESLIISFINFVLASVATVVAAYFINAALVAEMGLVLNLLIVTVRQIALILGVSVLTAFVSSFLPVRKIASQRPIDAIREK